MPMCRPGRLPTSTMWLCASMIPGITVAPRRSITLTRPPRSTWLPTWTKRPFSISTSSTTRFCASMVWMRPLTSASAYERPTLRVSPPGFASASAGRASTAASSAARTRSVFVVIMVVSLVTALVERAGVVHDVAVDHGEVRADLANLGVAYPEVVLVEHDQVGELALLDRAEVVLAIAVPGGAHGEHVQGLPARDLLARVDLLALRVRRADYVVQSGGGVVNREPRVMRRDVHAVLMQGEGDAALHEPREHRPDRQPVGARGARPAEARGRDAAVQRLQPRKLALGGVVGVLQAPAQALDAVGEAGGDHLRVHLLIGRDHLLDRVLVGRAAALAVLVAPARFRAQAL